MAVKKLILIGGGGHAVSMVEAIGKSVDIAGYADIVESTLLKLPYLGNDQYVQTYFSPNEYMIHHTVVYTDEVNLKLRSQIIQSYSIYQSYTFIAKTAYVSPSSRLGEGCAVLEGAVVNGANIGHNSIINTRAIVEHGGHLGDNVFVGPGAIICGDTVVGDNVLIGAGAVLRDGISIADNVVIGMGSIVTCCITNEGFYIGNPCRKIR